MELYHRSGKTNVKSVSDAARNEGVLQEKGSAQKVGGAYGPTLFCRDECTLGIGGVADMPKNGASEPAAAREEGERHVFQLAACGQMAYYNWPGDQNGN